MSRHVQECLAWSSSQAKEPERIAARIAPRTTVRLPGQACAGRPAAAAAGAAQPALQRRSSTTAQGGAVTLSCRELRRGRPGPGGCASRSPTRARDWRRARSAQLFTPFERLRSTAKHDGRHGAGTGGVQIAHGSHGGKHRRGKHAGRRAAPSGSSCPWRRPPGERWSAGGRQPDG